jgi:ring-1,2-phenylacetyl-CoA epoxidase subunit PaaC
MPCSAKQSQRQTMTYVDYLGEVEARSAAEALRLAPLRPSTSPRHSLVGVPQSGCHHPAATRPTPGLEAATGKLFRMPNQYHTVFTMQQIRRGDEGRVMDDPAPGRNALADRLLALADDELILAHRNSEWAGHAPILEEDIAFANMALDEMGHAAIWYGLRGELTGENPTGSSSSATPGQYRNVQLVELPRGDWAFSMVRQYLFDAAESVTLPHLAASSYRPLAEAAAKIATEERYHLRHTGLWLRRLGLGTAESHARLQAALDILWPYARQLFVPLPDDTILVDAADHPRRRTSAPRMGWADRPFLARVRSGYPRRRPAPPRHPAHGAHRAPGGAAGRDAVGGPAGPGGGVVNRMSELTDAGCGGH